LEKEAKLRFSADRPQNEIKMPLWHQRRVGNLNIVLALDASNFKPITTVIYIVLFILDVTLKIKLV